MKKKSIIFFFTLITILGTIYFHTNTLIVTHHKISLGQGNKKLRVAHITDLHTKGINYLEDQLIVALKQENPDITVITGDLANPSGTKEGYVAVLKELKTKKGVYLVQGNWEYWESIPDLKSILESNNIKNLTNQTHQIDQDLWLVGFDDSEEGLPELSIINSIPKSAMKIALFHSPTFFDKTADLIQLNFAGHTHGGQVRIPFVGPLWLPRGSGNYAMGWYEKGKSKLYVSRGIGTSILPIRFNCSPELAIIDINY
jgi:predicted MPP superfamily phosphohydrolase